MLYGELSESRSQIGGLDTLLRAYARILYDKQLR
jgi:hypothetical protein